MMLSRCGVFCLVGMAAALGGCAYSAGDPDGAHRISPDQEVAANEWMVNSIRDAAINQAIITQHTLFPYHFYPGRDTLNELGERDLAALAAYFRGHTGQLNIRRGDLSDEMYHARVATVRKRLTESGVDASRIAIADGLPGGPGMPSDQVVKILQRADTESSSTAGPTVNMNISGTPTAGNKEGGQ